MRGLGLAKRTAATVVAGALAAVGVQLALVPTAPPVETTLAGAPGSTALETLPLPGLEGRAEGLFVGGPPPAAGDVAIAPPPEAFSEPPAAPAPPPAALRSRFAGVVPAGGTWAVMVGINDYPGSGHDLRSAVNDAHDVNEALARMGVPGDHRLLIRDGQATADVIRLSLDWLAAHASPDATAVFFFAGHVRKLGGSTEAMVAADGRLVSDRELAAGLARVTARRSWIAIAACYGGGFTEVLGPGRVLTAAASANNLAYENLSFKRSYMVEYMVRRAWVERHAGETVEEAFDYARTQLSRDFPHRLPVQVDQAEGMLTFRSAGSPPPRASPQPAPSSSPPPPSGGGSQPPPTTAPPPRDNCRQATLGVIRCGDD